MTSNVSDSAGSLNTFPWNEKWDQQIVELDCPPELLLKILDIALGLKIERDFFRSKIYLHPNLPLKVIKKRFDEEIKNIGNWELNYVKELSTNPSLTPGLIKYFFYNTPFEINHLLLHPKCPRLIIQAYIFDEICPPRERSE